MPENPVVQEAVEVSDNSCNAAMGCGAASGSADIREEELQFADSPDDGDDEDYDDDYGDDDGA